MPLRSHGTAERRRVVLVHGSGAFGAAAWPAQHTLAGRFDTLFLRRTGFDPVAEPVATDFEADARMVIDHLQAGGFAGGQVVAHSQGAVAAMMAALQRPDLVQSLILCEPACLSLTQDLPATAAHIQLLQPVFDRRADLSDEQFHREFGRLVYGRDARPLDSSSAEELRSAHRLRLQSPPWEAPLSIVPGVPTLVLTGGWEPMYEEVADYLVSTGAEHRVVGGGHRPQDTAAGQTAIREFLSR
ncbi:alpha/beta fold hydrolase [Psychromicrobium xiongbiense]|uniref:alpha/beta fold hydrolase n=1 Tax=Psychromicrobium xiongbiense TaxID=3051184 RepID=UPI0025558FBA|nr:alpha/beta hydrolase [Psychromicrobium sp. YIM S02556]